MAPSTPEQARLLVVDDEPLSARAIERMARHFGHDVVVASSVETAIDRFRDGSFDVVLADVKLGAGDGFDLLSRIRQLDPKVPVVLITGYASIESAMQAIESGAFDYLAKPPELQALGSVIRRAIEQRRQAAEPPPAEVTQGADFDNIVGQSPQMLDVFKTVARVAPSRTNVLILGESGTGKELVARALHRRSPRSERRFVPVNVSAIPEGLLESELFGHVRGAFTGATSSRRGLFEEAHQGTLFLDEIGDLSLPLQAKLLRAIQEQLVKPVGGNDEIPVDVRLVGATHQNLELMMRARRFREDLYYRLNVVSIHIPPLRDRREDVAILVEHFLGKHAHETRQPPLRLSSDAEQILLGYSWPGNVRELSNVIERATVLSRQGLITSEALPARLRREADPDPPASTLPENWVTLDEQVERYVRRVLDHAGGNQTQAARILGISRRTLHRMETRRRKANGGETD